MFERLFDIFYSIYYINHEMIMKDKGLDFAPLAGDQNATLHHGLHKKKRGDR